MTDRLEAQFAFLGEADRPISVLRGITLLDGARAELATSPAARPATCPAACLAKSLDRVQPVRAKLMRGGRIWKTLNVTSDQRESRVGTRIAKGAPWLRDWAKARTWFG